MYTGANDGLSALAQAHFGNDWRAASFAAFHQPKRATTLSKSSRHIS